MLAALALALGALGSEEHAARAERPRVVVLVVFDQMIPEQLERLRGHWTGGLGRFIAQGRSFSAAAYDYGCTETAPGHATLATGRMPWKHGIVANEWLAPESRDDVYCVADPDVEPVPARPGRSGGGRSPRALRGPGLADLIEAAGAASKTVVIGGKDRAAILLGGRRPDVALWWDRAGGGFATSTWYTTELPGFAREWNGGWLERARRSDLGERWADALPADLEGTRTAADDRPGEADFLDRRHTFPYAAPKLSEPPRDEERARWGSFAYHTPLSDRCVIELACRAVESLELGADEHVDYLAISCSSCDIVGHECGPYSREVTDLLLRADRALEELFALFDRRVGAGRWLAVLGSDHGVLELPEALAARGVVGGRVSAKELGAALAATREAVAERFGSDFLVDADARGVRFSAERMRAAGVEAREVRAVAQRAFAAAAPWCERVFTFDELAALDRAQPWPDSPRLELHAFHAERSSDLIFQPRAGFLVAVAAGTGHGTWHAYDRRVPLVFLGAGVERGSDPRPASPADIVPTVLAALALEAPSDLDGRPLPLR